MTKTESGDIDNFNQPTAQEVIYSRLQQARRNNRLWMQDFNRVHSALDILVNATPEQRPWAESHARKVLEDYPKAS